MSNDPLDETIRGKRDRLTIDGVDVPVWLHEGGPPNTIYTVDELKRKIAESKAKTAGLHEFMVDEEKRQGELILIDTRTLYSQAQLDAFKRVGFGTCHIQQPNGAMKLVSVSIVAPQVDPWEDAPKTRKPWETENGDLDWDSLIPMIAKRMIVSWEGSTPGELFGKGKPRGTVEMDAEMLKRVGFVSPESDVMFQRAKAMSNELFGSDARGKIIHDGEGNLIIDDMNAIQPDEAARRGMYASWPNDPEFRAAYRKTLMGQYEELQDATHNMGRVLMQDLRDLWAIVRGWFGRK